MRIGRGSIKWKTWPWLDYYSATLLAGNDDVVFVLPKRLDLGPERFESLGSYIQVRRVAVAALDPFPGDLLLTAKPVKGRGSAACCNHAPNFVALAALPKIEVQDHVQAQLQTPGPDRIDQQRDSLEVIGKLAMRWILAAEDYHPFVVRKSKSADFNLQAPGKSGFARAEGATN